MPTAARGATLMILGALLAQAPLTAHAYEPSERTTPRPASREAPTASSSQQAAKPVAAHSWGQLVQQVTESSPGDQRLRAAAANTSSEASSILRCFKLDTENYCLGLGFVDQIPTNAQLQAVARPQAKLATGSTTLAQNASTGDLALSALIAQRAAMPKSTRVTAELAEMQTAWAGRAKARELRLAPATTTSGKMPSGSLAASGRMSAAAVRVPASAYIMTGYQTTQERTYWCGPASFQSIDWADDHARDTQASWAKDLGTTTSGTAITAMVRQTNLKTGWPRSAGPYIVQSVSGWNSSTFFAVHQKHLGVYRAPVIEHVQLLRRYFPYLAFNHSGHYQVGRGYNKANGTISIFEVYNERRFSSRGNITNGPKNIPASALFNATLANSFRNIGL